jgi:hypothetical protein
VFVGWCEVDGVVVELVGLFEVVDVLFIGVDVLCGFIGYCDFGD